MAERFDFGGWATRNNLRCADGRTILKDAFIDNDGDTVPLVWNHQHNDPDNVLGHALLKNRDEGVYAYCVFNDTASGQQAKALVKNGDVSSLSIYANQLKQQGGNVLHGAIREVSLVLAGANPGAYIDSIMMHGEDSEDEAIIYTGEEGLSPDEVVSHSDQEKTEVTEVKKEEEPEVAKEKTVQDVFDELTEEQKTVVYALIGQALEDAGKTEKVEQEEDMKHNVFDENLETPNDDVLSHSEEMAIFADGKRYGSLKESVLQHGITNIDYLFPDNKELNATPGFIGLNPSGWVNVVMNGVHHTPFSRIKMTFADITVDDARARGYVKGNQKVSEVFALLKRVVNPTTVYKKQDLDRDDVVDITDFDVVAWLKREMRTKLDEEIARAIVFGDGRDGTSNDKISESCIIPIVADTSNNLYAMSVTVTAGANETAEHAFIRTAVKSMDDYEGSGNTTLFAANSTVSDLLLMEDADGHRMYKNLNDLALAIGVERIVKVPAAVVPTNVLGVIVDLNDYNVGADKGGAVNMFDDFDIDYNKQKYLIETRCSGALIKPHSAVVLVSAGE